MVDLRMIKWFTERCIGTDAVWTAAAKKAIENMDKDSLKRILNAQYGLWPTQTDYMTTSLIWDELQTRNKEEKKMEDKKYYSGKVMVTTWRTRWTVGDLNDVMSNRRTDLITFKDGKCFGALIDPRVEMWAKIPFDTKKRFTKEEIAEIITSAWNKGAYADDQTDISWEFDPEPEGFTGTVDLATVLLKDRYGYRGSFDAYHNPQVRARCRVRIVDGTFFEKLDGSSELADILKNHKGMFTTKEDVEKYLKDKWFARDFGNDASYYILEIEEAPSDNEILTFNIDGIKIKLSRGDVRRAGQSCTGSCDLTTYCPFFGKPNIEVGAGCRRIFDAYDVGQYTVSNGIFEEADE